MEIALTLVLFYCAWRLTVEIWDLFRSIGANNWKRCQGKLIHWNVDTVADSESVWIKLGRIRYTYKVRDKDYENDRIGFGAPNAGQPFIMDELVEEIFSGAPTITVHYHPSAPQESVLCVGPQRYHAAGISLYLIAVLILGSVVFAKP